MSFRGKVRADAVKQRIQQKQRESERFKEGKKVNREFPPKVVNMERHFYFPKYIFELGLSKSALAIYPVLCSLSNFEREEWFYESQEVLAKMAGISIPQVRESIEELQSMQILKKRKNTEGTRQYYMYKVKFIRKDYIEDYKDDSFIFHTCIIDSGIWGELKKQRAKALYLAMRVKAQFDYPLYCDIELDDINCHDISITGENYRNRKWDVCREPLTTLCRTINISNQNLAEVLEQLEKYRLIERLDSAIKVYLKPKIREHKT